MAGCEYEYFQFKETPKSLEEKKWVGLEALTPGSESRFRLDASSSESAQTLHGES